MGCRFRPLAALIVATQVMACGCCSSYGPLQFLDPGTPEQQRQQAVQFDPYPEQDLGPAVVGGRPREYQIPPSEPARAQGRSRWFNPLLQR